MERNEEKMRRQSKVMSIVAVLVCVIALTVGFAAFSNTLTISSNATVKPDASTFAVKFSSSANQLATNPVAAKTLNPTTLSSSNGTIDNSSDPTISGLSVGFTEPGQSAIYEFYVRNEGEYVAYLNAIQIGEKTCTPTDGSESASINAACEAIGVSVKVGAMDEVSETTTGITGQSLARKGNDGDYATVYVTIEYASGGTRTDEEFSVTFGDIKLTYSTVTDFEVPDSTLAKVCTLREGETALTRGAAYNCDPGDGTTRTFYFLNSDGKNARLLMDSNIAGPVAWNTDGGSEPTTAMAALNNATSKWNIDVSLPTYDDIKDSDSGTFETANLSFPDYGYPAFYWTDTYINESFVDEDKGMYCEPGYAYAVVGDDYCEPCEGYYGSGGPNCFEVSYAEPGVRPVITISIEQL